jgi:GH35 family endo-1,4-beta-xylanase
VIPSNAETLGDFRDRTIKPSRCISSLIEANDPISPPDCGQDVLSFSPDHDVQFLQKEVDATARWVKVENMPFQDAYQIDCDTRFSDPENMQVVVPIKESFEKGDVLLISFWMRRPGGGGQPNFASFHVQSSGGEASDDAPEYEYKLSAYREWKQHVRSFVAPADYEARQSNITILLGEAGKIAEIADLRLVNYGREYDITTLPKSTVNYRGRAPNAQWRQDALARIEKVRKGDITVEVVDAAGNVLPDATVQIQMKRHAFGFGNTVNSEVLGADEADFPITPKKKVVVTWDEAQKYREVVKKHFDRVTFESELRPHNWQRLRSKDPASRRKNFILMEKTGPWLIDNQITARGHYIAWAPMDFNAVEKQFVGNPQGHRKWLWAHMADVLPATKDFVSEWDTINHIIGWGKHTYDKEYGGPEIYAEIMKEARRLAPDATHAINEGKVLPDGYKREPYKKVIRFLNEQGQAPDIVGFMGHFGLASLTPPEELLQVYDNFAEIAPSLQLSEFDVETGDDEELQADYYRDVMIASFSHPNFVAIVQWGFWEKIHWKPAAALWRSDWTLKPSGEVFVDLVTKQWWTNETLETNNKGVVQTRGFLGDYEITAEYDGKKATQKTAVTREGNRVRVVIP